MLLLPGLTPIIAGRRTSGTGATSVIFEIIPAANRPIWIKSIRAVLADTSATILSGGYPGAIGITPTTPVAFRNMNNGNAAVTTHARAWATPPTIPAASFFQFNLPGTLGATQFLDFGNGIYVPANNTFVLYSNGATTGLLDLTIIAQE